MTKPGLFFIIVVLLNNLGFAFCDEYSSLDLEPIVITKNKAYLINTYSVEFQNIRNLPFSSPVEVLSILPLDLQSRSIKGGIQTDFSLRGSTFQGILLLIDGQRINDPQSGHHNSDIPLTCEDIERIEVIPGIGSSLFGPDAIGGVINIILKKPKYNKRILDLSMGQHRSGRGTFSIEEKRGNLGIRFSLERQESDGFRYDTDFKKFTTTLNSSLDIPGGDFNINFGYQEKEFGAFDFYTPNSGYPSKEWTKTYLLSTELNLEGEDSLIKPNFLWRRHFDKFMLDKTQVRTRYLNHHRTDVYTPNIYFQKKTDILGVIGGGLEYGGEYINSTNLGKHSRIHKSIFFDNSKALNRRISLGSSFRVDDYDGFEETYTGSLNLRYKFTKKNSLHFSISRGIRVPSFTEIYYNDPTTVGNIGLSAEKSTNYQISYDYKKQDLSLRLTFFLRQEEDMIDWIKRTPSQIKWQAENITEIEVKGMESYFRLDIDQNLNLESNYTYIDKRINDRGYLYKYGQNYSRHLINTNLNLHLPFGTQSVSVTYKKKPHRDGWFLLNTYLSYNLNKKSSLFLKITNLLNVECQEIEGIPQPGRWIEAGIRLEW